MQSRETQQMQSVGLLAYTSDRGGTFDIWLHLPSAYNYPLTRGLGEPFSVPYWSPNGRFIAFIGKENIIYIVDARTRTAAQIDQIEPYTFLGWSPDSRFLTYVKGGRIVNYNIMLHSASAIPQAGAADAGWFPSGRELMFAAPDAAGNGQLYKINVDGTNKRQLTQNTEGPIHNARLSPDGSFALFTSPGVSISIITTVDLATGRTYRLEGGPLAKNYYPEWSPDSSTVAYSATTFEQQQYYSLIQTDSRTGRHTRTHATSNCFSTPVSWSPDGSHIAFLDGCGDEETASRIMVINLRNPIPFTIVDGGRITALQWSPSMSVIPGLRLYTNPLYRVAFRYPAHWRMVSEERFEGPDGFFQISAVSSTGTLDEVCRSEAFHPLSPYGSNPQIVHSVIRHQNGCFIFPSADQPQEMRNQAALIVRYPVPVPIQGNLYPYFILWADRNHIIPLARGLSFM